MSHHNPTSILTINSGSSSLKFALFCKEANYELIESGQIERIGHDNTSLRVRRADGTLLVDEQINGLNHEQAFGAFFDWLRDQDHARSFAAVGHRVVHGGLHYTAPTLVAPELIESLRSMILLAPEHLPHQIKAIEAVSKRYPGLTQVACFDTAFHRRMPQLAQMYPLPKQLRDDGVMRYGFHGLSYEYIVSELHQENPVAAIDRLVIAHLGNGASMVAVRNGIGVDTTMGFTPAGGLMMGTRAGDLDPGVLLHLVGQNGMTAETLNDTINKQSGLLGVSGVSSDMKQLLDLQKENPQASTAIELFCYQAKKFLGSLVAVLGGLDVLVFTGGIGEHAAEIRHRICSGLEFLGIHLDPQLNNRQNTVISKSDSPVTVRVIKTNEELTIARHTSNLLENH